MIHIKQAIKNNHLKIIDLKEQTLDALDEQYELYKIFACLLVSKGDLKGIKISKGDQRDLSGDGETRATYNAYYNINGRDYQATGTGSQEVVFCILKHLPYTVLKEEFLKEDESSEISKKERQPDKTASE